MTSRHDVTSRCKEGVKRNLAGLLNSTSFFLHLRFNQKWRHSEVRFGFFLPWSDVINFVCKKEWQKGLTKLNFRDVRDNCFGVSGSVDHCDTQEDQFPVGNQIPCCWCRDVSGNCPQISYSTQNSFKHNLLIKHWSFQYKNLWPTPWLKNGAKGAESFGFKLVSKQNKKVGTFLTYYYFSVTLTKQASFLQL